VARWRGLRPRMVASCFSGYKELDPDERGELMGFVAPACQLQRRRRPVVDEVSHMLACPAAVRRVVT
jgi:hypothetical protein